MKAGMVDDRAFVSPHQSIPELWQGGRGRGFSIEHSHRLAGEFAGLCSILFAVVCWFTKTKGSRWLGLIALALISFQGLIGYFRVALNSWWGPNLAWIHGCFAQVVFAVLVGLAILASRTTPRGEVLRTPRITRWALICLALVLGQLILGGVIRHEPSLLVARIHLIGAFIVTVALVHLARLALREKEIYRGWPWLLMGLLTLQVLLGVEAGINWMARYFDQTYASSEPFGLMLMRTSHYFVGSLLFAVTTVLAIRHAAANSLAARPA